MNRRKGVSRAGDNVSTDREARFRTLFETYAPHVYRYAKLHGNSSELAEEVLQETMLAVWQRSAHLDEVDSLGAWIYGIARKKLADHWRRVGATGSEVPLDTIAPLHATPMGDSDTALDIRAVLAQLDPDARELLFLAFYCGLRYEEVATIMQIPVGTVKSRVHYLRKRLRRAMSCTTERTERRDPGWAEAIRPASSGKSS